MFRHGPWAIDPSLIIIGVMMMTVVKGIDWDNMREVVPAFTTIVLMHLTCSISNGIIAGIGMYTVLGLYDNVFVKLRRLVAMVRTQCSGNTAAICATKGRIEFYILMSKKVKLMI